MADVVKLDDGRIAYVCDMEEARLIYFMMNHTTINGEPLGTDAATRIWSAAENSDIKELKEAYDEYGIETDEGIIKLTKG